MAGAGYRDWVAGDVPTAAQFDTFLQEQTVMVFASAAARDTALSVPKAEGMVTYQRDVNTFTAYNGSVWVDIGWFAGGVLRFASAAARDSALGAVLTEGLFAYLIDSNTVTVYTGAAWSTVGPVHGAWTAWTATITQSGAVTCTNSYTRYQRIGRTIHAAFYLSVTGSGTGTNAIILGSLPATAVSSSGTPCGSGWLTDASSGLVYPHIVTFESTTTLALFSTTAGFTNLRLGVTAFSGALASGDTIAGQITYEAAADA